MSELAALAEQTLALVDPGIEAEVTVNDGTSALTRFANSYIHQNVAEEGARVTLKIALDGKVASATTNRVGSEGLERLVADVTESARLQPVDPDWPGLADPMPVAPLEHWDEATAAAAPADRARLVQQFVEAGPGFDAAGYCETTATSVVFANSLGHGAEDRYTTAVLDGIHRDGTIAGYGHGASVRIGEIDGAAVGGVSAERAKASRGAVDIKAGEREVVLAPECLATICVFMSVFGFNAKAHQEGQSFVALGEKQFDDAFRLRDDATDHRSLRIGFDSEGTPKQGLDLVEGGEVRSLAHDRRTAAKGGASSTGHAFSFFGGYLGPVAIDLFVEPGAQTKEELVAGVEQGLYVSTFNYCRVLDPKTLVVTGLTRNGTFLIENGEITTPVTNLRFTQSFVEALGPGRVLGLGDDDRHADSEFGSGLVHCPSIRLGSWNFTGDASG
jgi:predicted Zn-dependent protease